jgi:hypothetical protein
MYFDGSKYRSKAKKKKTVDVECGTPNKAIMGDEIIMGISLVQHD